MWTKIIKNIIVAIIAATTTKVSFDIMKKSGEKIEEESKKEK